MFPTDAQKRISVAYFCSEYAVENDLQIYLGGLGVLAADLVLEAGALGLDFTAIGLCYGQDSPEKFGFSQEPISLTNCRVWSKSYGSAKLYLLDGGQTTARLYDPDPQIALRQQLLLGFGGVELLTKIGKKIDYYHLNEGHTSFVILALEKVGLYDKGKIVATKHTILPVGLHLTMEQLAKEEINAASLYPLGRDKEHPDKFSTTQYLLNFSGKASAVSITHANYEKGLHPDSQLIPITNGINFKRWQSANSHDQDKKTMIDFVNSYSSNLSSLRPDLLTLVWARRLVPYKRPELLLKKFPENVQIILAGRPDPRAPEIVDLIKNKLTKSVVFVPQYDLEIAKTLTCGADVWVNTPIPGEEACGTSGMKAGLNGALMLSTRDGWIAEQEWKDIGWIVAEENIEQKIFSTITQQIAPIFYNNPTNWQERVAKTKKIITTDYSTVRVLFDYYQKLYV